MARQVATASRMAVAKPDTNPATEMAVRVEKAKGESK